MQKKKEGGGSIFYYKPGLNVSWALNEEKIKQKGKGGGGGSLTIHFRKKKRRKAVCSRKAPSEGGRGELGEENF